MKTPQYRIEPVRINVGSVIDDLGLTDLYFSDSDELNHRIEAAEMFAGVGGDELSAVDRMMFRDALTYLPDDICAKVDRAAMAVSLETRMPYLDHRVVEFAWSLPLDTLVRGDVTKWALRQVLARYVPPALTERPKAGFGIPLGAWLRGPLREWADDLLAPASLRADDYLDEPAVTRLWTAHRTGRRDHTNVLWNVLMFQSWLHAQRRPSIA